MEPRSVLATITTMISTLEFKIYANLPDLVKLISNSPIMHSIIYY